MASLIWKGRQMEPLLGPAAFARAIAFFIIASGALYIASVYALEEAFGYGVCACVRVCVVLCVLYLCV